MCGSQRVLDFKICNHAEVYYTYKNHVQVSALVSVKNVHNRTTLPQPPQILFFPFPLKTKIKGVLMYLVLFCDMWM